MRELVGRRGADSAILDPMEQASEGNSFLAQLRRWRIVFMTIGFLSAAVWAWVTGWPGPIQNVDIEQGRLNTALPAPRPTSTIRQTFQPMRNGLLEVELLLVHHEPDVRQAGVLTVTLRDDADQIIAVNGFNNDQLQHNQILALRFTPETASAGRTYALELTGDERNNVSAWAYDLDVYALGAVETFQATTAQDLRFTTRYRLAWSDASAMLWQMFSENLAVLALALLMIPLPGVLILLCDRPMSRLRRWIAQFIRAGEQPPALRRRLSLDPAAWWGLALALGLAAWPILWYWLTLAGGRWFGWLLWLVVIGGWSVACICWWRQKRSVNEREPHHQAGSGRRHAPGWHWEHLLLLAILLISLAVRLLAVRDLHFPPWVDASRHALITTVMAATGQTIQTYAPYLPIDRFPYHFGFHTLPAGLTLMSDIPLERLLLVLGQLLNALVPLSMYTAGWLLTRRRDVGLVAAFLVALPFFFPGYYATWGRFTQLTGVMILPPLAALTWLLIRGAPVWRRTWWLVGVLAAGLLLIHVRVLIIYVPFGLITWILSRGRRWRSVLAATLLSLFLVAPRLLDFVGYARNTVTLSSSSGGYNEFPLNYVTTGWERYFLWAAAAALLLAAIAFWRRHQWATLPLALAAWTALVLGVISGRVPGIPGTWLINLNSAYITIFVPLGLGLAIVAGRVWRGMRATHPLIQLLLSTTAGLTLLLLLLFGTRQQIDILNPVTILAREPDRAGLRWLEENTPENALVAVNSWLWLGNTWAGSDGGAWLVPLTARQSTTPPADYVYDSTLAQQVQSFNESASEIEDWSDPAAAEWLQGLGVTHIFVGARGGYFDPAQLSRNPYIETAYSFNGAFVFALAGPAPVISDSP